ncbi:lipase [Rhodococcus sp. PAMC28707]|uniref:lipase family protein n=1 Tax=unclassified Rhodococcus (in: high G+C Gram-positive bacteria) TaxID=192944 RepID=UPI00109DDA4E|nr:MULTISPECIES: lipase family protein [unclassified Rhodococcus (in: high G+C Gram-positive bacteria)]QCB51706.1 lipase [Rhodococcus sp. PAMC28705]QCB60126.1 lipase [Rhodococcus sp. PAMC28707]
MRDDTRAWTRLLLPVLLSIVLGIGAGGVSTAHPGRTQNPVDSAPGTVQSVEPLATEAGLPGTARAHLLTYWTVGPTGRPALSSGTVFVPNGRAPAGGWPIISWAHGTVGVGDQCAPSRNPYQGRHLEYLSHWISEGYAVVATDYAGLGTPGPHAYLEKDSAARSVIDMVRAARSVESVLADRWLAIGQSQGGHAALQAAHIATTYAPELDYRGVVATGAPSNLEYAFQVGGPWIPDLGLDGLNVFATYVLAGLRESRPDLDVDSYLTDFGRSEVDNVEANCPGDLRLQHGSVGAMLSRPVAGTEMFDALKEYLSVPVDGYDRPIFLGQGLIDTMVPSPLSVPLVAGLIAHGQDVTYVPYLYSGGEFVGHEGSMIASMGDSTPFVHRLLDPVQMG